MVLEIPNLPLQYVDLPNGETLGYRVRKGGEKTILLLHGNMISSYHWDLLMESFDPAYTLVAPDLRGFGSSTYHHPIQTHRDLAEDVVAFMSLIGLKSSHVLAWSMGGGVAMKLAANYPDRVKSLILLGSLSTRGFPYYGKTEPDGDIRLLHTREEMARDVIKTLPVLHAYESGDTTFLRDLYLKYIYIHQRPTDEKFELYLQDMRAQRNLVDIYYANHIFNISDEHNGISEGTGEAKRITMPTLVLWCEDDPVVKEPESNQIAKDIGPHVQVDCLIGCGHSPFVDDLEQVKRKIIHFFGA